jgi:uncharacterized protein YegL
MGNNYDEKAQCSQDQLNLILLIDNSYSMEGSRMAQVNNALPDIKRKLSKIAEDNGVNLMVRIIAFSDEAIWVAGKPEEGVKIDDLVWTDLGVVGGTATNKAVREASKALHARFLTSGPTNVRILRPVVILITDGYCNPSDFNDYLAAIDEMKHCLTNDPMKDKITRIAIGVEEYNREQLEAFASLAKPKDVGSKEQPKPLVFEVDNTDELGSVINWLVPTSIVNSIVAGVENDDMPVFPEDPEDDDEIL